MSRAESPFASPETAAQWTRGLLVVTLGLCVIGIASDLSEVVLFFQATTRGISDADAAANDSRQWLIGMLHLVSFLGTSLAFLSWLHRANQNLPSLGNRDLKYTPGWAVGGFFVPFLNLVQPFRVMRELWHGSDPTGLERDLSSGRPPIRDQLAAPPMLVGWWACFLLSAFFGRVAARLAGSTVEQLQLVSVMQVVSDVLEVPSVVLAITLVGRITEWQTERAELLRQRGGQPLGNAPIDPSPALG